MPVLNRFDDYDTCMGLNQKNAVYCVVASQIHPDNNSKLYNFIAVSPELFLNYENLKCLFAEHFQPHKNEIST